MDAGAFQIAISPLVEHMYRITRTHFLLKHFFFHALLLHMVALGHFAFEFMDLLIMLS